MPAGGRPRRCGCWPSLLLVATTLAGYARLAVFDSDSFADRATAALEADSVRTVVGERVTDRLVRA